MIEVEGLTKRYPGRTAVDAISFRVGKGEIVGFLGPNGAGKSTTLRMLTGYLAPTAGRVTIDGIDLARDPVGARRRLGYMPEGVPLYPEMRVVEYLDYRARLKGVARKSVASAIERSLAEAQVADAASRIIGQLSKGYRQRVGLADALLGDPPLLILDEPTSGLDPNQMRQVRALVRGLAGKKTILLSTHILPEVEAVCGRVIIIREGKKVGEGETADLRARGARGQVLRLATPGARAALEMALGTITGARDVQIEEEEGLVRARLRLEGGPDRVDDVFRAIVGAGLTLRELRAETASLEDVFAELTTTEPAPERTESAPVEAVETTAEASPAETAPEEPAEAPSDEKSPTETEVPK